MLEDEIATKPPNAVAGFLPEERRLPFEGEDMGRILSLSDGIFAFAMTLLVLNLAIPSGALGGQALAHYLVGLGGSLATYVFAFIVIGSFWVAHHRIYRHLKRWDSALIWINMFFLITVAIDPFVIGVYMVAGATFPSVALAAVVWAMSGGLLWATWVYSTREHRLVDPKLSPAYIDQFTHLCSIQPIVFVVSIGVAVLSPSIAEYVWITGVVLSTVARRRLGSTERRRRGRAPHAPATP